MPPTLFLMLSFPITQLAHVLFPTASTWPKVVCIVCLLAQWEAAGQLALALAPAQARPS